MRYTEFSKKTIDILSDMKQHLPGDVEFGLIEPGSGDGFAKLTATGEGLKIVRAVPVVRAPATGRVGKNTEVRCLVLPEKAARLIIMAWYQALVDRAERRLS